MCDVIGVEKKNMIILRSEDATHILTSEFFGRKKEISGNRHWQREKGKSYS